MNHDEARTRAAEAACGPTEPVPYTYNIWSFGSPAPKTDRSKPPDLSWQEDALCAQTDANLWFPERGENTAPLAKAICAECPVRIQCLNYALDNEERFGIWGGLAPRELIALRRKRREGMLA